MCEKLDLSVHTCCAKAKLLLLISGIAMIVLVIFVDIYVYVNTSEHFGSQIALFGVYTVVIVFFPHKISIIINMISQILSAFISLIAAFTFTVASSLIVAIDSKAKIGPEFPWVTCMGFTASGVFSILTAVVSGMVLCKSGRGGGSSTFTSGTS